MPRGPMLVIGVPPQWQAFIPFLAPTFSTFSPLQILAVIIWLYCLVCWCHCMWNDFQFTLFTFVMIVMLFLLLTGGCWWGSYSSSWAWEPSCHGTSSWLPSRYACLVVTIRGLWVQFPFCFTLKALHLNFFNKLVIVRAVYALLSPTRIPKCTGGYCKSMLASI